MKIYITATGNISPQKTFMNEAFLNSIVEYKSNRLTCIEPDYRAYIDAKMIRRMSRVIKLGAAAAAACLKEATVEIPDAIITGTAYGCLEDTGSFLSKMIEYNEELLTPTAFIQSTHNTIGAQIALAIKCHNYNNAFVHRGFSFESALLDGILLLKDQEVNNVLVGAIDEITDYSHAILSRFGLYKENGQSNLNVYSTKSKGTIAGEGASFFLLSNSFSANTYATLDGISTFYKPVNEEEIEDHITAFLTAHLLTIDEIDLIVIGKNGDVKSDVVYEKLQAGIFNKIQSINYKNLCGEYPTATAFALWMAASPISGLETGRQR